MFLEIKHLNKSYQDIHVLQGLNLGLHKNETLSILGKSGGGKTTLP